MYDAMLPASTAAATAAPLLGGWGSVLEMCSDRIRSSTTVEATGSRPAVGSSYMITCAGTSRLAACFP